MKKYAFVTAMLMLPFIVFAQKPRSCCSTATQEFAMLGDKSEFRSAHDAPEPINFTPGLGKDITFPTPDGITGRAYVVMADIPTKDYLIVFHEWWGLNNHIRKECERLAIMIDNVNIIGVDLYDGRTADNADAAAKLMQSVNEKRAVAIVNGAVGFCGEGSRIQTIGWCFGGGWSLQGTLLAGDKSVGCVMYYGIPEKDAKKLEKLNAPVLGIFASRDGWVNQEVVDEFEKNMNALNKPLTLKWYDAVHAFANPSNPNFDKEASADASRMAIAFINKNFNH